MKSRSLDIRVCNCCNCGHECVSVEQAAVLTAEQLKPYRLLRGRIAGRPYCSVCLVVRRPPERTATREDDGGPWQQNAVRDLEER